MKMACFRFVVATVFFFKIFSVDIADLHIKVDTSNPQNSKILMIPTQVSFDFSKDGIDGIALKIGKQISKYAITTSIDDGLGLSGSATTPTTANNFKLEVTYLAISSIAALFRANATKFPKLAALFGDDKLVYDTFVGVLPQIEAAETNFSDLGDLQKCKNFVDSLMDKTLPMLMDALVAQTPAPFSGISLFIVESYKDEITKDMLATLTPTIANILNLSYLELFKVEQAVEAEVEVVKKEVAKGNYKYLAYAALGIGAISLIASLVRYGFGAGVSSSSNASSKK